MAESIENLMRKGRRINAEAKAALEYAAETRSNMKTKLAEARKHIAKCRQFLDTPPRERKS